MMSAKHLNPRAGILYMIPSLLGDSDPTMVLPAGLTHIINSVDGFVVENEKTARGFLKKVGIAKPLQEVTLYPLNKHTTETETLDYLQLLLSGQSLGLVSEAGCPGVADPGAALVSLAQSQRVRVVPVTGPSSILLALMASGMNGQSFAFNGYLPVDKHERVKALRTLELESKRKQQTQIFIETPYRNRQVMEAMMQALTPDTHMCVAANITLPEEYIVTRTVGDWKKNLPDIHKQPAVFLIHKY